MSVRLSLTSVASIPTPLPSFRTRDIREIENGARASQENQYPSKERMRASNTCDGCALRRVRCDAKRPCGECQKRSLPCTTFRVKRKRGPKGPRQTTNNKVREFQRHLQESPPENEGPTPFSMGSPDESPSPRPCSAEKPAIGPALVYRRQPLAAYCRFLDVFRTRMYSVWPIVSCDALVCRLVEDEDDYESWTLAASVCAGVIAQLRLPEHHWDRGRASPGSTTSPGPVSSHGFAADAEHFRTRYDYREQISVSSLLTSFFLHIFYANDDRLRAAGLYMRESLTQAHILGLHRSDTYMAMPEDDRELCLRVYWVLFISERTYCVQHGLPPILRPISERPAPEHVPSSDHISAGSGGDAGDGGKYSLPGSYGGTYSDGSDVVRTSSSAPIASFLDLTRLFTFLDGDLIEPPSAITLPPPGLAEDDKEDRQTRRRVTLFQSDLDPSAVEQQNSAVGLDETQRVDIFVTRNWIRILLWEYSVRHFVMSSSPDDQAFSMVLPALVAHSMLGFFSTISGESIRAHGYGMELKIFRIADSLLDVLACSGGRSGPAANSMLFGSHDTLKGLERVLATVGGPDSVFLGRLHNRMAEIQLPVVAAAPSLPPMLLWTADSELADDRSPTDECTPVKDITDLPELLQFSPPETSVRGLVDFDGILAMDLSVLDDPSLQGFSEI